METVSTGTLAGAGSFSCAACGYAVALREQDEIPACPSCGGSSFERSSMFGATLSHTAPRPETGRPPWLDEARDSLETPGDYLAYEGPDRTVAIQLKDGWTRVGRSLTADVRLDDPTVSRRHALIYRDEEGARVLDDRSLNGVFLNGQRVELSPLTDGDTVDVGRFTMHFLRKGPGS
ncbi:MAG: FHA domain containing protein [uncultured Thermomicrobiales bacterium]|uniref:FHA domain containing protein n=1 Tax=uncultured Thermomicrobiales bacterium TaxID=1645740 RepID=A0A6J4UTK5_9BACT|nr:MAG: FHA domain containing protein [uncultured Thermomicrobiales bacterium]